MHRLSSVARGLGLALSFFLSTPLLAGLRFQRAPAPEGADVAALAGDGTRLYAATIRGVWKLEAGHWALDGLGDKTLTSVAVAGGTPFAADGANVYRRGDDGVWSVESLPSANAFPSLLVASGSTLYAAGAGAFRRVAGTWSALPAPPGGTPHSIAVTELGDLVLGFDDGVAGRFSGAAWTTISGGIGFAETIQALVSFGGLLYAGTEKGVYGQYGPVWTQDLAFGAHDVHALAGAQGILRAATADAGVFRKSGSTWTNESATFLTFLTKCFGASGSDLFVGTGGGPVYRLVSGSWSEAKDGLDAAIVSDVNLGRGVMTTHGAGAAYLDRQGSTITVQAGCGDVVGTGLVFTSGPPQSPTDFLISNPCGAIWGGAVVSTGLPNGTVFTSTARYGAFAGTTNDGIQLFTGSSWVPLNSGLSDNASVQSVQTFILPKSADTYAAVGTSVLRLGLNNSWADISPGLPGGLALSLGGSERTIFAGLSAGGVFRRDGSAVFREDSAGLNTATVFSLDVTSQGPVGALGRAGVALKRGGGWVVENSGLPRGADVRVVGALETALYAGTAGSGLFLASTAPAVRTLPVVLDVLGNAGARFRTELTIGNRSAAPALVHVTFAPAPGFGAPAVATGTATTTIGAGAELHAADALDWLRSAGVTIPAATPSSPIAGGLSFVADDTDAIYAIARTYTADASGGTYGLFYDAPSDIDAAEDEAYIYGLRSIANVSRSNLAMVHLPGRSASAITLAVQVYSAGGTATGAPIPVTLQPGEWHQLNGILGLAGLPDGSFGYAKITRTDGIGPWTAYGVVNDAKTSDGSFLPLFRPGGVTAARRLLVPVVLDVFGVAGSHFTTELTLVNDGPISTPVDLFYQPAPGAGSAPGVPYVTVTVGARQQVTIDDIVQYLRDHGVHVPSAATGAQVGTLEASFRFLGNLDTPRTVALARTSTPNPSASVGGSFGLFYAAIAEGGGARTSALVPALTENASVRSNLALVHAGGGSGLPMTLSVRLHDAATGAPVGNTITATLNPGDWVQYSKVLSTAGVPATTTRAYAVVTRLSGDDTFYAYGVLNDNITSDGSFLEMIPSDPD